MKTDENEFKQKHTEKPVDLGDVVVEEKKKDRVIVDVRNQPKNSNSPPDSEKIRTTFRDIGQYKQSEALKQDIDTRGLGKYLADYFTERTFLSLIFKKSILTPLWVRFAYCLLFISLLCVLNAMLFSDEYIDRRMFVLYWDKGFEYTLVTETLKVIFSLYVTKILLVIIRWIWKPRGSTTYKLNESLALKDDEHIAAGK
jgi:hypothetical protein